MKKLLFLLLFPLLAFGQDIYLDHSVVQAAPYNVGDEITIKFNTTDNTANGAGMNLIQFDFQYNNKLLQYVSHTFNVTSNGTNGSAQTSRNAWNGYTFSPSGDKTHLTTQYNNFAGGGTYTNAPNWSVNRITIQDATDILHNETLVSVTFKILDKGLTADYNDYLDITSLSWARIYDDANSSNLWDVHSLTHNISLTDIKGGDAGDVVINLKSNAVDVNAIPAQDYWAEIFEKTDWDTNANPTPIASGQFDNANKRFTAQGLINDTEYVVKVSIINQPSWLDNVVTIADLALIFKQAIGTDINGGGNTLDYHIQNTLGDIVANQTIDFADSYEILAFLNGVTTNTQNATYTSVSKGAVNYYGLTDTFGQNNNGGFIANNIITPTDNLKSFNIAHALKGDVNFSHSYEPTAQGVAISAIAKSREMTTLRGVYAQKTQDSNLDLVAQIVDGKVEFSINIATPDMIGAQFNIEYDKTKLVLDEVIFDTGNDMTNFSNHIVEEGKVRLGSFDQNFTSLVKSGTPYKLIFTPIGQIDNTLGLITFKVNEGVKADGTQVNFQIN